MVKESDQLATSAKKIKGKRQKIEPVIDETSKLNTKCTVSAAGKSISRNRIHATEEDALTTRRMKGRD